MTYYQPATQIAVRNRLLADATLCALLNTTTSIYIASAPASATMPYVVLTFMATTPQDAMNTASREIELNVDVWVSEMSTGVDAQGVMASILARIQGDWFDHANRTPDYGLDRWIPTLASTDWVADMITFDRDLTADEPGRLHMIWTATVRVHKAGS